MFSGTLKGLKEFHVKKTIFFLILFLGWVKGGPIKLTLLIGGLDDSTRNLNKKIKIANLKTFLADLNPHPNICLEHLKPCSTFAIRVII